MGEEYLADHFPTFPVMPGVLMLQTLVEAGSWLLRGSEDFRHSVITLREARNVKYGNFMEPGRRMTVTVELIERGETMATLKGKGESDGQQTVSAKLVLSTTNLRDRDPKPGRRGPTPGRPAAWPLGSAVASGGLTRGSHETEGSDGGSSPVAAAALAEQLSKPSPRRSTRRDCLPWQSRCGSGPGRRIKGEGGTAIALQCDVADPVAVQSCVEKVEKDLGPVDILVNNAGVIHDDLFIAWSRISGTK